jgi:NAD(P)-dependent dehydrogenase (short-subunit alcohol dehydrogenase family)
MKTSIVTRNLPIMVAALCACFLSMGSAAAEEQEISKAPTVVITGANRGLGLEFARQYAADGWQVIGTARTPADASELRALSVDILPLDVTSQQSVDAFSAALKGQTVDLLINNAGIFPRVGNVAGISIEDYDRTLAVNLLGPVRVTRALLPNLQDSKLKTIVNISSQLGSIGLNTGGNFYGYRESKAALNMFSRTLAMELAKDGFTVVALHPGWVQTDMGGKNAPLTPEKSVSGMRSVIDGLTPAASGTYLSYEGEEVPW